MTLQPAQSVHYAIGKCSVCGKQTSYYICRGRDLPIYCPDCRKDRRGKSGGKNVVRDDDGRRYTMIHDPRGALRDLWACAEPTFGGYEILSCMPYGKYQESDDYPFVPGCRFKGERGGLYGVYISRDNRMIFGRVTK
jgi:hypothetical protein